MSVLDGDGQGLLYLTGGINKGTESSMSRSTRELDDLFLFSIREQLTRNSKLSDVQVDLTDIQVDLKEQHIDTFAKLSSMHDDIKTDLSKFKDGTDVRLSKISKLLSRLNRNVTDVKSMFLIFSSDSSGYDFSTKQWDPSLSPTWVGNATGSVPPWNQKQYKYCQPLFDGWSDLRNQMRAGSLVLFTGGLGLLMIEDEYEAWVCPRGDPCALGGDRFFCYVYNEQTAKFVPWDQHFNLNLFPPMK